MIMGLTIAGFTLAHVAISLVGLLSGAVAIIGMLGDRKLPNWTAIFLLTTVLTSVTGFLFPFDRLLPSHYFGFLSLAALAIALYARYGRALAGRWRLAYIVTAVLSFYLNAFVAIVQAFLKLPFLQPLAPTQSEPPFAIAQAVLLIGCLGLAWAAARRFGK